MNRRILFLSLTFLLFSFASLPTINPDANYVYICDSSGATKYHLTSKCRGLSTCKHDILKVTIEQARSKGKKTLCGWED